MSARPLAAWCLAALVLVLTTSNPVYRLVVVLCALNLLLALRRPEVRLRPLLLALLAAAAIATLITIAVSHSGTHVLVSVPGAVPVLGGPITAEAVVYGLTTGLGIAGAVLAAAPLSLVLQPHQLVDALPPYLARTGAVVGTAVNLIPGISRSATEIRDAQAMRGWRARRIREWPDIAVPVVLTALDRSMQLAEAMEARGYGAAVRAHYSSERSDTASMLVAVLVTVAAAAFVALRITGTVLDWYPYPSVTMPSVEVPALLCCLSLALPLLLERRAS